jgi:benzoate/toluate 1,2-dioxygenase beta subunit
MTRTAPEAVVAFLTHEANLLDEGRFEDWLALFTEDATYWVPSQATQADPYETVSLMYDDRRLLETRVRRLSHTSPHAQEPRSQAVRQVTNTTVLSESSEGLEVRSKFTMVEYRRNEQRLFAGTYLHRLRHQDGAFRIGSKRVNLVNAEAEHGGLVLPF